MQLRDPKSDLSKWIVFNLLLLAGYLGFFHLSLVFDFPWSLLIGVVVASLLTALCVKNRHLFINRFEFLIYLVVPVDILLESLIPLHEGYSFYGCALSFWMLFILYRTYQNLFAKETRTDLQVDEPANTITQTGVR